MAGGPLSMLQLRNDKHSSIPSSCCREKEKSNVSKKEKKTFNPTEKLLVGNAILPGGVIRFAGEEERKKERIKEKNGRLFFPSCSSLVDSRRERLISLRLCVVKSREGKQGVEGGASGFRRTSLPSAWALRSGGSSALCALVMCAAASRRFAFLF